MECQTITSFFQPLQNHYDTKSQVESSLDEKINSYTSDFQFADFTTKTTLKKKMIPILSLAGGGTRGYASMLMLQDIKKRTGLEPSQAFKLIAGTSIGGIEAGILTVKNKDDLSKPAHTVEEVVQLFENESKNIFPTYSGFNPYRWMYPEYDRKGLQDVLMKYVGDALVSDSLTEIMIHTVCDEFKAPFIFTRNEILHLDDKKTIYHYPKKEDIKNLKLIDIQEASAAAPTYFYKKEISFGGSTYNFRDGGLCCNNPCMSAYSYSYHLNGASTDYLVCSIGTGKAPVASSGYLDNISYLYWGKEFADYSIAATQETAELELKEILTGEGDDQRFFNFQPDILAIDNSVDDTSKAHFDRLKNDVKAFIEKNEKSIDVLCKKLKAIANTEI